VHQEHRSSSDRVSGLEPLLTYGPRADAVALLTDRNNIVGSYSRTHHQVGSGVLNVQERGGSEDEARMRITRAAEDHLDGYVTVDHYATGMTGNRAVQRTSPGKLSIYVPRDRFPAPLSTEP